MQEREKRPGRIDGEIVFAEKWARWQGYWYHSLTAFKIIAAGSIPVILTISKPEDSGRMWAGILGGMVAVMEALRSTFELEKRWTSKRLECEALKRERCLYEGRAGIYAKAEDPDALLIERTEAFIEERIAATLKTCHRAPRKSN